MRKNCSAAGRASTTGHRARSSSDIFTGSDTWGRAALDIDTANGLIGWLPQAQELHQTVPRAFFVAPSGLRAGRLDCRAELLQGEDRPDPRNPENPHGVFDAATIKTLFRSTTPPAMSRTCSDIHEVPPGGIPRRAVSPGRNGRPIHRGGTS